MAGTPAVTRDVGDDASGLPPLRHYAKVTVVVVAVLTAAWLLYQARSVLLLLFLGGFVAIGLDPFVAALQRRGLRRGWAVLVLALALFLFLVGAAALLIVPAVEQGAEAVTGLPELLDDLSARIGPLGERLGDPQLQQRVQDLLGRIPAAMADALPSVLGVLTGVAGVAASGLSIAALTVYFLLALPNARSFVRRQLGERRSEVMDKVLDGVGGYVTGQLVTSVIAGVTATVGLTLLGVPYAAVLGVAVALLDLVPLVGATLAAILCGLVALTQGIGTAAGTVVFLGAYQQLENYVIVPRVYSRAIDLSAGEVFVAALVGGWVGGILGALVALPIAAGVKTVLRAVYADRLEEGAP